MSDTNTGIFGIHAPALALRQDRMQLLASNLANADTPHFRARDIDFGAALSAAMGQPGEGAVVMTSPGHVDPSGSSAGASTYEFYRTPLQPSLDGNTVDSSSEQAAFGRAALEYRASLTFVEGTFRTMMTAITGQ